MHQSRTRRHTNLTAALLCDVSGAMARRMTHACSLVRRCMLCEWEKRKSVVLTRDGACLVPYATRTLSNSQPHSNAPREPCDRPHPTEFFQCTDPRIHTVAPVHHRSRPILPTKQKRACCPCGPPDYPALARLVQTITHSLSLCATPRTPPSLPRDRTHRRLSTPCRVLSRFHRYVGVVVVVVLLSLRVGGGTLGHTAPINPFLPLCDASEYLLHPCSLTLAYALPQRTLASIALRERTSTRYKPSRLLPPTIGACRIDCSAPT